MDFCATHPRCSRSRTRRSTRTTAWFRGTRAPINLVYSQRNRSACIRIPITGFEPEGQSASSSAFQTVVNPYIAFSAMLMAGLDGIKNKIEPAQPVDKDLYELPPDEAAAIPTVPRHSTVHSTHSKPITTSSARAMSSRLDLIETWIDYKRTNEIDPIRVRPHP